MNVYDIKVGQGIIAVIYDVSFYAVIDEDDDEDEDITLFYDIKLYDYNFKFIIDIDSGDYDFDELIFKFIISEPCKSLIPKKTGSYYGDEEKSKLKVSLGYEIDNEHRPYWYINNIDVDNIIFIKEAHRDKTIIFNNNVIVRYETNIIIKIILLRCFCAQQDILPTELQAEIEDILLKVSHIALKL